MDARATESGNVSSESPACRLFRCCREENPRRVLGRVPVRCLPEATKASPPVTSAPRVAWPPPCARRAPKETLVPPRFGPFPMLYGVFYPGLGDPRRWRGRRATASRLARPTAAQEFFARFCMCLAPVLAPGPLSAHRPSYRRPSKRKGCRNMGRASSWDQYRQCAHRSRPMLSDVSRSRGLHWRHTSHRRFDRCCFARRRCPSRQVFIMLSMQSRSPFYRKIQVHRHLGIKETTIGLRNGNVSASRGAARLDDQRDDRHPNYSVSCVPPTSSEISCWSFGPLARRRPRAVTKAS